MEQERINLIKEMQFQYLLLESRVKKGKSRHRRKRNRSVNLCNGERGICHDIFRAKERFKVYVFISANRNTNLKHRQRGRRRLDADCCSEYSDEPRRTPITSAVDQ